MKESYFSGGYPMVRASRVQIGYWVINNYLLYNDSLSGVTCLKKCCAIMSHFIINNHQSLHITLIGKELKNELSKGKQKYSKQRILFLG